MPIADKWKAYQALVLKYSGDLTDKKYKIVKPDAKMLVEDTPEGLALKDLGLSGPAHICCARMLLSHIDIMDQIS